MTIDQVIDSLKRDSSFNNNTTFWKHIPAREALFADFPKNLDKRIIEALQKHGIKKLYTHQTDAITSAISGKNTVIVTPTAS